MDPCNYVLLTLSTQFRTLHAGDKPFWGYTDLSCFLLFGVEAVIIFLFIYCCLFAIVGWLCFVCVCVGCPLLLLCCVGCCVVARVMFVLFVVSLLLVSVGLCCFFLGALRSVHLRSVPHLCLDDWGIT